MTKNKEPKEKKKTGPKEKTLYNPDRHPELITWMRRYGLTCLQIAKELKIGESTLASWRRTIPEVKTALSTERWETDNKVAGSLLKRALGYHYKEVKRKEIIFKEKDSKGKPIRHPAIQVETTIKHLPGDVLAQKLWLTARSPDLWKEKVTLDHSGKIVADMNVKSDVMFYIPSNKRNDASLNKKTGKKKAKKPEPETDENLDENEE